MSGFNPMRHDCNAQGCYLRTTHPHVEQFHDCFPGNNRVSDVDFLVNLKRHFMFIEWKASGAPVLDAQRIWHETITDGRPKSFIVFQVWGNPATMEVNGYREVKYGIVHDFVEADLDALKKRFSAWAGWASPKRLVA